MAVVALGASLGATPTHALSGETIVFCFGLASVPAFEPTTTEAVRERLENALAAMTGRRQLSRAESHSIRAVDGDPVLKGVLANGPGVEFVANLRSGRLSIINHRVRELEVHPAIRTVSDAEAVSAAMGLLDTLHEGGVIDRNELDLEDLRIEVHKQPVGAIARLFLPNDEQVVDYRITVRRRWNAASDTGSFVQLVVHRTGEFSELNVAALPLNVANVLASSGVDLE